MNKYKHETELAKRIGFNTLDEALEWYRSCANDFERMKRPYVGAKTLRYFADLVREQDGHGEFVWQVHIHVPYEHTGPRRSDVCYATREAAQEELNWLLQRSPADAEDMYLVKIRVQKQFHERYCDACGYGGKAAEFEDGDWGHCPSCGMV